MFSSIWTFLKALPQLLALYNELKELFQYANDKIDSKQKIKQLQDGIAFAKKTKNTKELERFFRGN
jgi:hypothetical protein